MIRFKNISYLTLVLIFFSCSSGKFASMQDSSRCNMLTAILEVEDIHNFIQEFKNNYSIRINDLSNFLEGIETCNFGKYSLRIKDKLSADLNTGRYIDITILSVEKKEKDIYEFKVFYAPKVISRYRDKLLIGTISVQTNDSKADVIQSKIGYFD